VTWAGKDRDVNPNGGSPDSGTNVCFSCKRVFVSAVGFGSVKTNGLKTIGSWKYEWYCAPCKKEEIERRKRVPNYLPVFKINGVYESRAGNTVTVVREEQTKVFFIRDGVERSSKKSSFAANYRIKQ